MDRSHWETAEVEQLRFRGPKGRPEFKREELVHGSSDYSKPLINIVKQCLKFDPAKRPIPQAVLSLVQKHMEKPVAGDADDLCIRLDDKFVIGKEYRSGPL